MKKDLNNYIQKFDELNVLVGSAEDDEVMDVVETLLILAYKQGREETTKEIVEDDEIEYLQDKGIDLSKADKSTISKMEQVINQKIDGKTYKERIAEHLENGDRELVSKVAETEFHRIYEQSSYDAAERIQRATGRTLYKRWVTVGDNKVRATHEPLEGIEKPLNEKFYTIDGDEGMFPGGFENASNNCGCRCILEFI